MSDQLATEPVDAFVLGDPEPKSEDWYALRREGITATDLPQILGLSQYGNARTVFHTKRGELEDQGTSEAALWGHLLEDVVAREWATRYNRSVTRVGVLANRKQPWQRASCDRLIVGANAALEVKTRNQYAAGKWRDDMPDDVLAQVAWQRMVGGFDYVAVACLVGGQHLVTHQYERDSDLENMLQDEASRVWGAVVAGTPPTVDFDTVMVRLLERLFPNRVGEVELDVADAVSLLMQYAHAQSMAKIAKQGTETIKAKVLSVLGSKEVLTQNGEPIFTYRPQQRSSLSLRELEQNDPELYSKVVEGGHIKTTSSRVLRAARKGAVDVELT
jgi:putative phage-type endonuclease